MSNAVAMKNSGFTTAKGTNLPVMLLRGKEYLEVKYRIVWFREEHPTWSIETEFVAIGERSATAKATIRDESGRIISTSHKSETSAGFADFLEKSETGAIGRALALIGYGTQFCADELDEGERIVDSPVSKGEVRPIKSAIESQPIRASDMQPGPNDGVAVDRGYMIDFGQWNKRSIEEVYNAFGPEKIASYIDFLETNAAKKGERPAPRAQKFIDEASSFLAAMENRPPEHEGDVPF